MPNESSPLNEAAFKKLFKYEPEAIAGKGIVVTGGTTGIGRAITMLLVAQGAKVLILGRHAAELGEALADLKQVGGGEVYGIVADTSKPEDVIRIFETADRDLGRLDVLVNNAAPAANSVLDGDPDEWRRVVETNLLGYFACSRAAAERFQSSKAGHLVHVGPMSAKDGEAGSDVRVATKGDIRGFTDSLASQLNGEGVRVMLIEPDFVGPGVTVDKGPQEGQSAAREKREMPKAEELAHAVLYALQQPAGCDVARIRLRPTRAARHSP